MAFKKGDIVRVDQATVLSTTGIRNPVRGMHLRVTKVDGAVYSGNLTWKYICKEAGNPRNKTIYYTDYDNGLTLVMSAAEAAAREAARIASLPDPKWKKIAKQYLGIGY